MCVVDPISLGVLAIGAAVSAGGALAEGAAKNQIAQKNAQLQVEQGRYEARQIRAKVRYANAAATVKQAGTGMRLAGSFMDIIGANAVQGEIDAYNAEKFANDNASISRMEGEAAQTRGMFSAVSSVIGAGNQYLRMT